MGPTSGETYIKKATYSLVPPAVPTDSTQSDAWLSIWIEAVLRTMTHVSQANSQIAGQEGQPYVAVANGATIDFEITTVSSGTVTQKVYMNDKVVSQLTDSNMDKNPKWVIASNECYSGQCGSLDGYTWSNVTITLSAADESFGDSLSLSGATSSGFTSSDNGVTWNGDIKFEADQFPSS
ncbi:hypothetical protein UCDDS831_g08961 [Diplodia seriata]|uniref:Uncharacterized protein n=1 Tax=Diplodia seriata TaxID=420778 RepID=A0A0G2FNG2_9PEZI|nr:hypothetical protein UCDDS831_g08961 [Diplodia seriata]